MRAALYARFSTDNQNVSSVDRQLQVCREFATARGARVVREFHDDGISGTAMGNRPGVLALLQAARRGEIDAVIAEHTDRLSRAGSDGWAIFEDLEALGVRYLTVHEGQVTEVDQGVSSLVSAMKIREVRVRTRGGLEQVVRSGRSAGGLSYGYAVRREYDAKGEPIRGLRDILPEQAAIVVRIFEAYARGESPQRIAGALNRDEIAGPSGGAWNASTIAGNAKRGNGVIHNELYRGIVVFGRQSWIKDRRTGARRARTGDPERIVRQDAPELRIVSDELWEAVRARHTALMPAGGRPEGARRPKRLLSGLIRCGCCGGKMNLTGPGGALRCHARVERGPTACENNRSAGYAGVEARVLASIQEHLLHPEVIEAAMETVTAERRRRSRGDTKRRHKLEADLAEVKRRSARLVDQVAAGELAGAAVRDALQQLEARRAELEDEISTPSDDVPAHPASPKGYRKIVERLGAALQSHAELAEAGDVQELLRNLIREVQLHPLAVQGTYRLEILGDLAVLIDDKKPGPISGTGLMSTVGAGTRNARSHRAAMPVTLAA